MKTKLLFIFVAFFLLFSCNKQENARANNSSEINGFESVKFGDSKKTVIKKMKKKKFILDTEYNPRNNNDEIKFSTESDFIYYESQKTVAIYFHFTNDKMSCIEIPLMFINSFSQKEFTDYFSNKYNCYKRKPTKVSGVIRGAEEYNYYYSTPYNKEIDFHYSPIAGGFLTIKITDISIK